MKKAKAIAKILITLCIIVVVIVAIVKMQSRQCEKIHVKIDYEGEYPFLTEEDVVSILQTASIPVIGREIKDIDIGRITKEIDEYPFVEKTNKVVYAGTTMIIDISLKKLLLHIYPEKGEQYFMDKNGVLLPYSPQVKENLIVANGAIKEQYKPGTVVDSTTSGTLLSLMLIAQAIEKDQFSNAQFRQIFVNNDQTIELIPSVGRHTVLFGDESNVEEKLFNLKETYKNALVYKGMNQYAQLDVRFKNRIIAKKR